MEIVTIRVEGILHVKMKMAKRTKEKVQEVVMLMEETLSRKY